MKLKEISFERKQKIVGYLFCLPLILGVLLLFIPNIFRTFLYSINEIELISGGYNMHFKGLNFYKVALLENEKFNGLAVSSLGNMLINLPIIIIFSLFIASLLNKKFMGRTFVRSIFFLPIVLSTGIVSSVQASDSWSSLSTGVTQDMLAEGVNGLNTILSSLNLGDGMMKIIVSSANSISSIVTASGMQILLFLTAFQEISPEYYEAASVDGCSQWEMFWKITIPIMVPQIAVNAIYTVADSFVRENNQLFNYINGLAYSGNQYSLGMAMFFLYLIALAIVIAVLGLVIFRMLKATR